MRSYQFNLVLSALLSIFVSTGCGYVISEDFARATCVYEDGSEVCQIMKMEVSKKRDTTFIFQSITNPKFVKKYEMEVVKHYVADINDFNFKMHLYAIYFEKEVQGTCDPFLLKDIKIQEQ